MCEYCGCQAVPAIAELTREHDAEHREVEAVLDAAAAGAPAEPGWPDRLLTMLEMLREHILKEQDGVFPAALAGLDTAGWEAVDAVRARVGTAAVIDTIRRSREEQGLARE